MSEDDNRWQMDLVDVYSPGIPAGSWKFFLVAVNVFDRFLYARPLSGKDPPEVAKKLKKILEAAAGDNRKKPQIISSDSGSEFQERSRRCCTKRASSRNSRTQAT